MFLEGQKDTEWFSACFPNMGIRGKMGYGLMGSATKKGCPHFLWFFYGQPPNNHKHIFQFKSPLLYKPSKGQLVFTLSSFNHWHMHFSFEQSCRIGFQDQNFGRATWMRSSPKLCACLLPKSKYVVTARWTLLAAQDQFSLLFFPVLCCALSSLSRLCLMQVFV